jgi:hypothetical protein
VYIYQPYFFNLLKIISMKKISGLLVMRSLYNRMKLEPLVQTIEDLSTRAEAKDVYKCIMALLPALREKKQEYIQHFASKNSTGKLGTIDRNKCKSELFDLLDDVFDLLERNCNGDADFITYLGLELRSGSRTTKKVVFGGRPTIVSAKNTNQIGELDVQLAPVSGAHIYGFEWSADGGINRQNGQYSIETNMTIKVAPHSEIMVWAFAVGNVNEKSELSEPMLARSL